MTPFGRLGIGTVQFGMTYGVNNASGRTPESEAKSILESAIAAGCHTIDTAAAYGDAEEVVGRILGPSMACRIVTKSIPLGGQSINGEAVKRFRSAFATSLQRLSRNAIYGLLIHHPADLLAPGGELLHRSLCELRDAGLVQRIGVSIYDRAQIEAVLDRFDIDLVQLPLSVLDQRLLIDGTLDRLKARGIEIHARSVFLQGLLLMERTRLPAHFEPIADRLRTWDERVANAGLSPSGAAAAFVLNQPQVDCAIIGFDSFVQFETLRAGKLGPLPFATADLACNDPVFVNPGQWRLG